MIKYNKKSTNDRVSMGYGEGAWLGVWSVPVGEDDGQDDDGEYDEVSQLPPLKPHYPPHTSAYGWTESTPHPGRGRGQHILLYQVRLDWLPLSSIALIRPSQLSCLGSSVGRASAS